jgi:ABC-type amino acid transport substrate-binding protein
MPNRGLSALLVIVLITALAPAAMAAPPTSGVEGETLYVTNGNNTWVLDTVTAEAWKTNLRHDRTNAIAVTDFAEVWYQTEGSSVLKVYSSVDYPPFEFVDPTTGQYTGFDIELTRAIAERFGLEIEVLDIEFAAIVDGSALDTGLCGMGAAAITITDERELFVDFSDPYYPYNLEGDDLYGFVVAEGNHLLRLSINDALTQLRADGTYDILFAKYFSDG